MAESPESAPNSVSGPLTQEKVESTYADIFQGLGKFPGDPYELRLKPDAVPAKHRPRKVPESARNPVLNDVTGIAVLRA